MIALLGIQNTSVLLALFPDLMVLLYTLVPCLERLLLDFFIIPMWFAQGSNPPTLRILSYLVRLLPTLS
jgi:hypothetical protein